MKFIDAYQALVRGEALVFDGEQRVTCGDARPAHFLLFVEDGGTQGLVWLHEFAGKCELAPKPKRKSFDWSAVSPRDLRDVPPDVLRNFRLCEDERDGEQFTTLLYGRCAVAELAPRDREWYLYGGRSGVASGTIRCLERIARYLEERK